MSRNHIGFSWEDEDIIKFLDETKYATDEWTEKMLKADSIPTEQFDNEIMRIMKKVEEY